MFAFGRPWDHLATALDLPPAAAARHSPHLLHDVDLPALTTYTMRGLLESNPTSPYRSALPTQLRAVADAVAKAAAPSFLVALITSSTLAAADHIPDPPRRGGWHRPCRAARRPA